jgi:hypothetical protein
VLQVGPQGLGVMFAAPGVGAWAASVLMLVLNDIHAKGRWYALTCIVKPLVMMVFALSVWMPLSLAALAAYGFLDVAGGTLRTTILQVVARENIRGRTMSLDNLTHRGLGSLNGVPLGASTVLIGAPLTMTIGALSALALALVQIRRVPSLVAYRNEAEYDDPTLQPDDRAPVHVASGPHH